MVTPRAGFSIEAIVLGRNDEYEPNWTATLHASLQYNRQRFEAVGVDYRVAFVEWNPPPDRPLLAPDLVKRFFFLRAIVIDRDVHQAVCEVSNLDMMLNFAYNPALRTSLGDYALITSGDLFFGRALATRIGEGLRPNCLYRAERVNIREDIDVVSATPEMIEAPEHTVSVDSCSEPPYDKPPYSHASGDFLLVDRVTMVGLRGLDESIRFARLHLDSRFCFTAMHAGLDCELLGRIYHLNHRNAYTNRRQSYPGRPYDYNAGLPYVNPVDWGLAEFGWSAMGDRLWRIGMPQRGRARRDVPATLESSEIERANAVTRRLLDIQSATAPPAPVTGVNVHRTDIDHSMGVSLPRWEIWDGARIEARESGVAVTTLAEPWAYSAALPLQVDGDTETGWQWLRVRARGVRGSAGIGILCVETLSSERVVSEGDAREFFLVVPSPEIKLLVRNAEHTGPSAVVIEHVSVVAQHKQRPRFDEFLLGSPIDAISSTR